jgi:RND family efflux transporter MFP subunit
MKGRTLGLVGIVGVGLVGATVAQVRSAGGSVAPMVPAAVTPGERRVAAEGRVATYPGGEVIVGTERAGRLVRVAFEEGQAVRRGELVAELDSEEIRAALAEARARLVEGEAELRLAEATLERRRELAEQRVISAHDLDQARRDLDTALARIETARATVARHEAQLAKARIVAPISGTVIARHVDAGETLEAGARVVTLGDLSRLRVEAEADEADAAALELGAPATITADGYPGRSWRGSVEEIADAVTPRRLKPQDPSRPTDTRILALKIAFAEPSPLKLGTTVELRIRPAGR